MHLSMLTPGGGGSGICGVFDHQLVPDCRVRPFSPRSRGRKAEKSRGRGAKMSQGRTQEWPLGGQHC